MAQPLHCASSSAWKTGRMVETEAAGPSETAEAGAAAGVDAGGARGHDTTMTDRLKGALLCGKLSGSKSEGLSSKPASRVGKVGREAM